MFFFFDASPTTEIYTLSLHDALPIHFRERLLPVLANQTKHLNLACYVTATAGRAAGSMLWFMRKKFGGSCLLLSAAKRSQNLKFPQQRSGSSSLYVAAIAEADARLGNTDKALGIGSCVRRQPSDMFRRVICRCSTRHREIWMRHSHG